MNIRKNIDYSAMFAALDAALFRLLPAQPSPDAGVLSDV